jgi:hypothetical protein
MTRQLLHIVPMPTQYFTQERVVSYFVTMTTKIINVTNSVILVSLTLSFYLVPEDDDLFFDVNQDTLKRKYKFFDRTTVFLVQIVNFILYANTVELIQ